MAEELLVGDQLTSEHIRAGGLIVDALDKLDIGLKGAFWILLTEPRVWRLYLATSEARTLGPKAVYQKIAAELQKLPSDAEWIGAKDISVVEDRDPLFLMLRSLVHTGPGIAGIRVSRNVIDGRLIEDSYIYRTA